MYKDRSINVPEENNQGELWEYKGNVKDMLGQWM